MVPGERSKKRLVLIPGLGTDHRIFSRLTPPEGWEIVSAPWLLNQNEESLRDHAHRMAEVIERMQPDALGGHSFGGMLAIEAAEKLGMEQAIIIGSIRDGREAPKSTFLLFRVLTGLLPGWALGRLLKPMIPTMMRENRIADRSLQPVIWDMFRRCPWSFVAWSVRAITGWRAEPRRVRIRQVHGELDRMFPVGKTDPERVLPGAGHMLPFSDAQGVSRFLADVLVSADAEEPGGFNEV